MRQAVSTSELSSEMSGACPLGVETFGPRMKGPKRGFNGTARPAAKVPSGLRRNR